MKSFNEWLGDQHPELDMPQTNIRPWKMTKKQLIPYWESLQNTPIIAYPIDKDHKGSTYGMDGMRITGSRKFIESIISHLKDFLAYETDKSKLQIVYKQVQYKESELPKPNSYVFYLQIKKK